MNYLSDWTEKVVNRDNTCVICGIKENLEAHHVFKSITMMMHIWI